MKKKLFTLSLLFASMLSIFTSCEKDEPAPPSAPNVKDVEIVEVTNIRVESATFKGVINKDLSDSDNYEFGVYISDNDYIGDYIEWGKISEHLYKADILVNGEFSVEVEGLDAGETYYCSAYLIINNDLYIFENDHSFKDFTTLESSQSDANGHTYVDLGLPSGVKWATCNLGAEKAEEVGDYFAWGKYWSSIYFGIEEYIFIKNGSVDFTGINKYTIPDNNLDGIWYDKEGNFIGDNKRVLSYEDDAARSQWGGDWRMPRENELYELFDENNCMIAYITNNGVKGLQITSKINGRSIFLPYTGVIPDAGVIAKDVMGAYWANCLSEVTQNAVCYTILDGSGFWEPRERYIGACIRPVLP